MLKNIRRPLRGEAELDITSFMNLMIVLVPVLLLNMVFSHITVLDIQLPEAAAAAANSDQPQQLELVLRSDKLELFYPSGQPLTQLPHQDGKPDFSGLSEYLQRLKQTLQQKGKEKRDIVILMEPQTDYQTLVSAMDAVRSFKAVVAASVVDAELFPEISLGDAPVLNGGGGA